MEARFIPNADLSFTDRGGFPFLLNAQVMFASKVLARRTTSRRNFKRLVGKLITVPAGFKTDLASIPRPLWAVLPPVGAYDAAAVVHDYLYQHNGVSRADADAVLLEAMRILGVRWTQRAAIYAGVRLGGWVAWRKYRRRELTDGQ